ncbi:MULTISPECIES: exonuclease domain-containing protein [unclassified Novosphingobium]|uniref:exonuclease domain-containing protein n=1 Tax=unclassified Novosphingobium TaxID=2644732 RepID=UPI001358211D|nr:MULTISPECIES: exonuclease domain-containing protein [unclassified Novosphingobium]
MTIIRVIDFETSGVDLPEAEVCEAATCDLHLDTGLIEAPASWLCKVKEMPPQVRAVHHISLAECQEWAPFDPALMFNRTNAADAIAAHNAEFETQFFESPVPVICTYKVALRVWPEAPAHNNGALRYWLEDAGKIAPDHALTQPAHRAGPDAYVTAHILKALFDTGVTGKQMVAWTKEPRLLPRCPIGKFRDKPWSEVEAGFLGWMLRQPDMAEDLKWNARREIERRDNGARA